MKISVLATPDRAIIASMHGPLYHEKDGAARGAETAYNTARDKAEQDIVRRCATDPEFAALCEAMTTAQWEDYLDEHCGQRPGRAGKSKADKAARRNGQHGGARVKPVPEGYIDLVEAAELLECSPQMADWYRKTGARRHGQTIMLRSEKRGKIIIKPEWVEEFKQAAWWLRKAHS